MPLHHRPEVRRRHPGHLGQQLDRRLDVLDL